MRRRLDVAAAMAWESLVETHARHALEFIALMADLMPFDESMTRYLREMSLPPTMAIAVRTRVLVALEDEDARGSAAPGAAGADDDGPEGWRRFRPDVIVRGVRERQRRNDANDRTVLLAIARAEEGLMLTHIDNAITFAAMLEPHMPLDRAVQEYIAALDLTGGRAQAVLQRTMARLAEVHLPLDELQPLASSTPRELS